MATVYKLDPLRDPRWQALVDQHPHASVFHTVGWLQTLHRTYGYRPVVFTTSSPTVELQNGLAFCKINSFITGPRMVSLPFSDHCEPLIGSPEELTLLVDYLQAEMDHQEWRYLELRPADGRFNPKGTASGFRATRLYFLHRLCLRPELQDIFRSFHKDSVQRRIQRAQRAGLVLECGRSPQLLKDFYGLFLLTRRRHRLPPQPYVWFQNLIDLMGRSLEIRVAYNEQEPIAAILTLRFRNIVYYKYGCSSLQFKNLGATPLLLWKTIQDSKATGAEEFDLGRSDVDNEGLNKFKNHWVERPTQMAYWRYPGPDSVAVTEGWKLKVAKEILACVPHRFLGVTGKLIYRHIG